MEPLEINSLLVSVDGPGLKAIPSVSPEAFAEILGAE